MASAAASAASQHRCVFVGNIPYDATEEQLMEICREVGPVVSFRLVTDRETGKPKGYGFCEYKDEETALSARRNLQGYEINGRQLRVDFAENDKNADRSREQQGRGGPGLGANVDHQKLHGGSAIIGESYNQPIGLHIAMTAATVMSGALGGVQIGMQSSQSAPQNQAASDPLTFHLAKMSRSQLIAVMSELKVMATQNGEAARQLLLAKPPLSKALFQAQIMLGMVSPQMLQMPNIRQNPSQLILHSSQAAGQPAVQTIPTLPPLAQKTYIGLAPKVQQGQSSALPQNSLMHNQFSVPPQPSVLNQTQSPHTINNMLQQPTVAPQPSVMPLPSVQYPSIRPGIQLTSSASLNQHIQPPFVQHMGAATASKFGHNSQKPGPLITPGNLDAVNSISGDAIRGRDNNVVSTRQTSMAHDSSQTLNHPSKLRKLEDGKRALNGAPNVFADRAGSGRAQSASGVTSGPLAGLEEPKHSDKQTSQLAPDMESVLLQQVLNLTPEQINSLPPEQRQQVIQLQQALRQQQIQPS